MTRLAVFCSVLPVGGRVVCIGGGVGACGVFIGIRYRRKALRVNSHSRQSSLSPLKVDRSGSSLAAAEEALDAEDVLRGRYHRENAD
ncbi:unnamed protein product [Vitrella brassicaformis CCMP3155]|uniref:Uncharacterized protein n=1 Tax=Vitrella brassicaformis (strain CCMP3155) TaxID=1169540 RepID=A0A0G4H154_VITBC|nr:unnamed protein product [Vitrella brassicaformis CCMP3155]|eukprot:CEM37282.1 unnamed protein product [Vitrella brassicaformis CCMP3155]